jgi:hypothetical protein
MRKFYFAAIVTLLVILSVMPVSADIAADLAPETNAEGVQIAASVEEEREKLIGILEDATPEEIFAVRDQLEEAFLGLELDGLDGFGKFYKFFADFKDLFAALFLLVGGALTLLASKMLGKKIQTNNQNMIDAFKGSSEMWEGAKATVDGYTAATNAYLEESRRKDELIAEQAAEIKLIQAQRLEETKVMTSSLNQSRDASVAALRGYIMMIESAPGIDEIYRKHFVAESEAVIASILGEGGDRE